MDNDKIQDISSIWQSAKRENNLILLQPNRKSPIEHLITMLNLILITDNRIPNFLTMLWVIACMNHSFPFIAGRKQDDPKERRRFDKKRGITEKEEILIKQYMDEMKTNENGNDRMRVIILLKSVAANQSQPLNAIDNFK